MADSHPSTSSLLRALARPALRYCLHHALGFHELLEAIKAEYVCLAQEAALNSQKRVTVSQLSVMTGLNRREVTRLCSDAASKTPRVCLAARVLSLWEQDARFCSGVGKPRVLSLSEPGPRFQDLVASVSKDVNPASVLLELERTGAVSRVRSGVKLIEAYHSFHGEPGQIMDLLAADLETLTSAVEENAYADLEIRNLHLRTEYDNIFVADIPKIRRKLLELGSKLHRDVRTLLTKHDKDLQPHRQDEAGMKVSLGTFSLTSHPPKSR
jgi:hypothetical protein